MFVGTVDIAVNTITVGAGGKITGRCGVSVRENDPLAPDEGVAEAVREIVLEPSGVLVEDELGELLFVNVRLRRFVGLGDLVVVRVRIPDSDRVALVLPDSDRVVVLVLTDDAVRDAEASGVTLADSDGEPEKDFDAVLDLLGVSGGYFVHVRLSVTLPLAEPDGNAVVDIVAECVDDGVSSGDSVPPVSDPLRVNEGEGALLSDGEADEILEMVGLFDCDCSFVGVPFETLCESVGEPVRDQVRDCASVWDAVSDGVGEAVVIPEVDRDDVTLSVGESL